MTEDNVIKFPNKTPERVPLVQAPKYDINKKNGLIISVTSMMVAPYWFDEDPHKGNYIHQLTNFPQVEATEFLKTYMVTGNANAAPRGIYGRLIPGLMLDDDSFCVLIDGYPEPILKSLAQTLARNAAGMRCYPDADRVWYPLKKITTAKKDKSISNLSAMMSVRSKIVIPSIEAGQTDHRVVSPNVYYTKVDTWEDMDTRIREAELIFENKGLNVLNLHTVGAHMLFPELYALFEAQERARSPIPQTPLPPQNTPPPPPTSGPTTLQ